MFFLNINELFSCLSKLTLNMSADYTSLFVFDSKIENLFETMNEELRSLAT